jgi:hypothetical protein
MFIETDHEHDPRSSGAQCFRESCSSRASISLRWSEEESFGAPAFYKHEAVRGGEPGLEESWYYREFE